MSENSNHRDFLERLFQKKAEEYDIAFRESDWDKLEGRLDRLDRQYAARRLKILSAVAAMLLAALLGYWTYEIYPEKGRTGQQQDQPALTENQESVNQGTRPPVNSPDRKSQTDVDTALADQPTPSSGGDLRSRSNLQDTGLAENNKSSTDAFRASSVIEQLAYAEPVCDDCGTASLTDRSFSANAAAPAADQVITPETQAKVFPEETYPPTEPGTPLSSRFPPRPLASIGLVVAPDLSTVGSLSNFYNPGYKIGLTVEFNVTSRLGISAGVIRSTVRYTASGNEYSPPAGYWTNGTVPYETIGECVLLDIPINLRYTFKNYERSRLYATAGIASYVMLNEDYRFHYEDYDSGLVQGWQAKTGTRHWLSNAGFSIGYELDIMKNLSLRAEPFVRIPLKEVGWGNVKLYSLGSFFSVNYSFSFNK